MTASDSVTYAGLPRLKLVSLQSEGWDRGEELEVEAGTDLEHLQY